VDLEDLKTKRIVWDDFVHRDGPVGSKNVRDVVASVDRNLRAVVKETAAGNRQVPGCSPPLRRAGKSCLHAALQVSSVIVQDGLVHFYDDIYGHHAALQKVLAKGYSYPS
jgi:hypothetical protein